MIVQWHFVLIIDARVDRLAVIGYAVAVNIATAGRENAVGTRRGHLEDWRYLETPGQIKNTGQNEPVSLVFAGWSEVDRVKFDEHVLGLVTEIRRLAEPRLRLRKSVVRVQLKLV